ncbi:unnamed protein product [Symbiodinium sp. CCMP2592]|nr:unnamed protein product [Symbiodinium sp. CCMP2592]CAE7476431.1 unnamed protein product [Symbiodinium sp. CCMP2592]
MPYWSKLAVSLAERRRAFRTWWQSRDGYDTDFFGVVCCACFWGGRTPHWNLMVEGEPEVSATLRMIPALGEGVMEVNVLHVDDIDRPPFERFDELGKVWLTDGTSFPVTEVAWLSIDITDDLMYQSVLLATLRDRRNKQRNASLRTELQLWFPGSLQSLEPAFRRLEKNNSFCRDASTACPAVFFFELETESKRLPNMFAKAQLTTAIAAFCELKFVAVRGAEVSLSVAMQTPATRTPLKKTLHDIKVQLETGKSLRGVPLTEEQMVALRTRQQELRRQQVANRSAAVAVLTEHQTTETNRMIGSVEAATATVCQDVGNAIAASEHRTRDFVLESENRLLGTLRSLFERPRRASNASQAADGANPEGGKKRKIDPEAERKKEEKKAENARKKDEKKSEADRKKREREHKKAENDEKKAQKKADADRKKSEAAEKKRKKDEASHQKIVDKYNKSCEKQNKIQSDAAEGPSAEGANAAPSVSKSLRAFFAKK